MAARHAEAGEKRRWRAGVPFRHRNNVRWVYTIGLHLQRKVSVTSKGRDASCVCLRFPALSCSFSGRNLQNSHDSRSNHHGFHRRKGKTIVEADCEIWKS